MKQKQSFYFKNLKVDMYYKYLNMNVLMLFVGILLFNVQFFGIGGGGGPVCDPLSANAADGTKFAALLLGGDG